MRGSVERVWVTTNECMLLLMRGCVCVTNVTCEACRMYGS